MYRELETLVAGAGTDPAPSGIAEQIQQIATRARQGPALPPADEERPKLQRATIFLEAPVQL